MPVHHLYIYTRTSQCIYHYDYTQPPNANPTKSQFKHTQNQTKLLWGLTYSLRDMLTNMVPTSASTPSAQASNGATDGISVGVRSQTFNYLTNQYKLYYYNTSTGYRIILLTSVNVKGNAGEDILYSVYKVLVDACLLCPGYVPGSVIDAPYAIQKLNNVIQQSPIYNT